MMYTQAEATSRASLLQLRKTPEKDSRSSPTHQNDVEARGGGGLPGRSQRATIFEDKTNKDYGALNFILALLVVCFVVFVLSVTIMGDVTSKSHFTDIFTSGPPQAYGAVDNLTSGRGGRGIVRNESPEMKDSREEKHLKKRQESVDDEKEELVSFYATATADVQGNLADVQVVTSPKVDDWLKDRWQAAENMEGKPIPGTHWIELDLRTAAVPTSILLDWENAYCDEYTIEGRLSKSDPWLKIATAVNRKDRKTSEKHVVDAVGVSRDWVSKSRALTRVSDLNCEAPSNAVRYVRLTMHKPATQWGTSLWRFEVNGKMVKGCTSSLYPRRDVNSSEN